VRVRNAVSLGGRHHTSPGAHQPSRRSGALSAGLRAARAAARDRAWLARGELTGMELPSSRAAGKDLHQVVIDIDATLVTAHSEKEGTAGTFKGGYGYHPINAYLDNTNEALAGILRPGNAGSNTAADHVALLDLALAQLPERWRAKPILIRVDGAGFSHALIDHLSAQGFQYCVGYPVTEAVRTAIAALPAWAWDSAAGGYGVIANTGAGTPGSPPR